MRSTFPAHVRSRMTMNLATEQVQHGSSWCVFNESIFFLPLHLKKHDFIFGLISVKRGDSIIVPMSKMISSVKSVGD